MSNDVWQRKPCEGYGAGNGIRTRDPHLGKVVLYQLSYSRPSTLFCTKPTVKGTTP